jgi:peptidyl-prolyl cis-trans isomerase C
VKSKAVASLFLIAFTIGACRKSPAGQGTAAAATPGQVSPAASGGPAGAPAAAVPPKPVPAELPPVVARVNGQPVTKDDFERMIKTIEGRAGQAIPPDRRDEILRGALDQLVIYTLLSQESKTRGVKIDEKEIDGKVQQIRSQFPTQEAFDKAVKDRGWTLDRLRHDATVDLSVTKLMEIEVSTVPGPSDAETKEFYEKNPNQFKQDEQLRASHILIRVDEKADAAKKAKAKAEIDTVLKQARAGADFAKLAQQHSQDASAAQGGDLGFFSRGQGAPAFDKAAFELKPGQISDVVTTPFGYHVIKAGERKPGRVIPLEEASDQIKRYLLEQKKAQHAEAYVDGLKKKSKIEVLM